MATPDLQQKIDEMINERICGLQHQLEMANGRIKILEVCCVLKAKVAALEVESKKQRAAIAKLESD